MYTISFRYQCNLYIYYSAHNNDFAEKPYYTTHAYIVLKMYKTYG